MRWTRSTEILLSLLLVFCVFARGGVAGWALVPAAVLCLLALLTALRGAQLTGRPVRIPALAFLPLAGAALCLFQLLPWPPLLLRVLDPTVHEMGTFALAPLGLSRIRPITLDAPATLQELCKHLLYFFVLVTAHSVGRDPGARRRLLLSVAGISILLALLAALHLLMGWETFLGLLPFKEANPPLVTPFGNPNHLAGFLVMGAAVLLSLLWAKEERDRRGLWGICYVLVGAMIFLSLSRGGILAFVASQVPILVLFLRAPRADETPWGWRPLISVLAVCAVLAISAYLASDRIWAEFFPSSSSVSKVAMWPELARVAWHYPFGMGRGAFLFGYSHAQQNLGEVLFTHPENVVLQLACEFGWLPALALCGAGAWLFIRILRARLASPLETAALCGVAGLLLQNLFDFSLEYLACGVAAAVLLGATSLPGRAVKPRGPEWTLAAGAVLATLIAILLPPQAEADEEQLAAVPPSQLAAAAMPFLNRHPADPWLYLDVAEGEIPARPAEALAWVNRALWLRPSDARAHRVAAHALRRLNRPLQALLEYRAFYDHGGAPEVLFEEAVPLAHGAHALETVVPPDLAAPILGSLAINGRGDEVIAVLNDWDPELESMPGGWKLLLVQAGLLRLHGQLEAAEPWLRRAELLNTGEPAVVAQRAMLLSAEGRVESARSVLKRDLEAHPDHAEVSLELAREQLRSGEHSDARRTVRSALMHASERQRTELLSLESDAYAEDGLLRRSVESMEEAVRAEPQLPQLHYQLAQRLEQLERFEDAAAQVREGMAGQKPQVDPTKRAWLEVLIARAKEKSRRRSVEVLELGTPPPGGGGSAP